MKKLILSILALLLLSTGVWAAPSISGLAGTADDGNTITISGSSFGANGLDISWTGGSSGIIESTTNGQAPTNSGKWNWRYGGVQTYSTTASTTQAHSHNKSVFVDTSKSINQMIRHENGTGYDSAYISWWVYLASGSYSGQWKILRLKTHDGLWTNDDDGEICWFNYFSSHQFHLRPCTQENVSYNVFPGQSCSSAHAYQGATLGVWPITSLDSGKWVRMEVWFVESDADSTNGQVDMGITRPTGSSSTIVTQEWNNHMTRTDSQKKEYIIWQNYYNGGGDFYIDDLYVSAGTQARVDLGNASTLAA